MELLKKLAFKFLEEYCLGFVQSVTVQYSDASEESTASIFTLI